MLHILFRLTLVAFIALLLPSPILAQTLPGLDLLKSETDAQSDLAAAIREAAQSGVNVVVLDTSGRIIATDGPANPVLDIAASAEHGSRLMHAQAEWQEFRETLDARLKSLPDSINEVLFILRATSPDGRISTFVDVLLWSALFLGFGLLAERLVYARQVAQRMMVPRIMDAPEGYRQKLPFLLFRFLLDLGGIIVSVLVAYVLGLVLVGAADDLSVKFTATAIFTTYIACRVVVGIWRMVLSPYLSQYRIPAFSDSDANKLFRWLCILATLDAAAIMFTTWIADFGLNYDVYAMMYACTTLVLSVLNICMVLSNRRAISIAIRNHLRPEDVAWINRVVSYCWAPFVVGYVVFAWFELAFDLVLERPTSIPLIAGAYGVIISILAVYSVFNYLIEQYFHRTRLVASMNIAPSDLGQDVAQTPSVAKHPMMTFEHLARRVSGVMAFVAGGYALIRIWDQEEMMLRNSGLDRASSLIFVFFVGYIIYHIFRIWIDRKIAEETVDLSDVGAEVGGDGGGMSNVSRLGTLLPLFRNFILSVVVVSISLIALLEIGVNVSPLFAGAGVVGLAVGFGSQALVRDIFSGAFFLFDDAFRKGEYIDIGTVKGTVERISVRSFQLRHHLGALHTIPFGQIHVLTNYSRDWVIMKLPLRVTYDTDVEHVRKLIKKLGISLLDDPVIGATFIQPLKSQGVIEMQDSAMIIRVKFMTKPGDQWLVRKKVYEEIRALFAREGITFAHREVTVRLADGKKVDDLTQQQRDAVAGAAHAVINETIENEGGSQGGDDR